jgi:hypothetical protein
MSTDTDLRAAIEKSFGTEPPLTPVSEHLAQGRRRLRRRRWVQGAAIGTATAAAVTGIWIGTGSTPGGDAVDRTPVASTPSPTPADQASDMDSDDRSGGSDKQVDPQSLVSHRFPATYDNDGRIVVKEGWRITRTIPNPMGFDLPQRSVGLVLTDGRSTVRWMLVTHEYAYDAKGNPLPGALSGGAHATYPDEVGFADPADWIADIAALNGAEPVAPLVVEEGGQLAAGDGATLMETRPAPVIADYSSAGDRMAKVSRDGEIWFVLARGTGESLEVIPVDAATLPAPTFAAFVERLRAGADSGAGVR